MVRGDLLEEDFELDLERFIGLGWNRQTAAFGIEKSRIQGPEVRKPRVRVGRTEVPRVKSGSAELVGSESRQRAGGCLRF